MKTTLLNFSDSQIAILHSNQLWHSNLLRVEGEHLSLHVVWGWHFGTGWYRWWLRSPRWNGAGSLVLAEMEQFSPGSEAGPSLASDVGPSSNLADLSDGGHADYTDFFCLRRLQFCGVFLCYLPQTVCSAKVFALYRGLEVEQMWFSVNSVWTLIGEYYNNEVYMHVFFQNYVDFILYLLISYEYLLLCLLQVYILNIFVTVTRLLSLLWSQNAVFFLSCH